jgi:hydrogenase/urease accessory protein HupE
VVDAGRRVFNELAALVADRHRPATPALALFVALFALLQRHRNGIAKQRAADAVRLAHGAALFDALYAALTATTAETGAACKTKRSSRR